MKTFYRLEGESGRGVYSDGDFREILDMLNLCQNGPTSPIAACDDGLYRNIQKRNLSLSDIQYGGKYRFGFTSKEKLLRWFPPDAIRALAQAGLRLILKKIPATEILNGDAQDIISRETYEKYPSEELSPLSLISENKLANAA
jgi:hypothetical protein